jgi:signal transduction histidine kinase
LGLGLALARQTVLDHGGDMWTESAAGARFVFRLPLKQQRRFGRTGDLSGQFPHVEPPDNT